jgi:diguanylate cyclase (GGDEF)-like protein
MNEAMCEPAQTILIVDDAPENLRLMHAILKPLYRVKAANNGHSALKLAQADPRPDLILLDVTMPELDGYSVCRQLKAEPATAEIPVLFLSARNDSENEEMGFAAGGADYITKPISRPILEARVRVHLENKTARDFLRAQNTLLETLARTDPLTGVGNRRQLREAGAAAFAQAAQFREPMSVLMLDIDRFKRINDSWGHACGDSVITAVASTCRDALRASDTVARLGGEEFALVLPATGAAVAGELAERLRSSLATLPLLAPDGTALGCTVSIGVATLDPRDTSFDELLLRADHALYRAKEAGRNRVVQS